MLLYSISQWILRLFYKIFYPYQIIGLDHLPSTGGMVVSPNHISNLDPPLLGLSMKRPVRFMAKEELFRISLLGKVLVQLGAFPVKRGGNDSQALKTAMRILKDGDVLGIFPEGTRSKTGQINKVYAGAALFALRTQVPLVPVAIVGPYRLFRKVRIIFGEPIDPKEYLEDGKATHRSVDQLTGRWKLEVNKLLDQYR